MQQNKKGHIIAICPLSAILLLVLREFLRTAFSFLHDDHMRIGDFDSFLLVDFLDIFLHRAFQTERSTVVLGPKRRAQRDCGFRQRQNDHLYQRHAGRNLFGRTHIKEVRLAGDLLREQLLCAGDIGFIGYTDFEECADAAVAIVRIFDNRIVHHAVRHDHALVFVGADSG